MQPGPVGDAAVIVFPEGTLSDVGRRDFSDMLIELVRHGEYKRIVVDFSKTKWLSSIDLGVFAFALKECKERRVALNLAAANRRVRRVFETTHLDGLFGMFETVEEAKTG
jgi:anti-sigma B factor antagonist